MSGKRINIPQIRRFRYLLGFVVSFLFLSVLVISIFSITVFTQFIRDYRVDTIDSVNVSLENAQSEISKRLQDMQELTFRIDRNFGFTYQPHDIPSDDRYNPVVQLRQYRESNRFYSELGFYRYSEPDKLYLSEGEMSLEMFRKYFVEYDGGKDVFLRREGVLSVFPCRMTGSGSGRPAYTFVTGMPYNDMVPRKLLLFFVEKRQIDMIVQNAFGNLPVKLLLYDDTGRLMYSFGDADDGLLSIDPEGVLSRSKPSEQTVNGIPYMLFGGESGYNQWQYVAVVDMESLLLKYNSKRVTFIITFCICMTVIFLFTILFAIYNYSPIKRLIKKIRTQSGGPEEDGYTSEIDYIEHTVDQTLKKRQMLQKKLVLSNVLWGQYENDKQALSALSEAGLLIPYDTYRVCVIRFEDARRERAEEFLSLLEELFDYRYVSGMGITTGIFDIVMIINYDEHRLSAADLREKLHRYQVVCLTKYGERPAVGVGGAVKRIGHIHDSFQQARNALLYFGSGSGNGIVVFEEVVGGIEANKVPEYSSEIKRLIRSGDSEKAIRKFRDVYEHISPEDERLRYVFYNIIDSIISILEANDMEIGEQLGGLIDMLVSSRSDSARKGPEDICEQLESLITHTCSVVNTGKTRGENGDLLEKIKSIIDDKLCDNMLSLEGLADACGVSPSYLGKFFKKAINTSPMQYVDQKRMEYVKKLLCETDDSINDIVIKSGFIDVSNFIRKFKKLEGVTPAKYRSNYRDYGTAE